MICREITSIHDFINVMANRVFTCKRQEQDETWKEEGDTDSHSSKFDRWPRKFCAFHLGKPRRWRTQAVTLRNNSRLHPLGRHRGPQSSRPKGYIDVAYRRQETTPSGRVKETIDKFHPLDHLIKALETVAATADGTDFVMRSPLVPPFGALIRLDGTRAEFIDNDWAATQASFNPRPSKASTIVSFTKNLLRLWKRTLSSRRKATPSV
ncbi:hypothetical protein NEUTE1DRAFT_113976 [Neurospora tetrasperma FGSC 2508]|uniref:Uncharacterized protein n=1 Tax=Neurospora tetrasperma (strain FGSC 2508 / ATCC MYA-4615 / P0657) TaxID=510951 RepID=F8MYV4_NEUT8|nr:uncharacterized protein NEUTE1DRAFT_113976 [Neurospora tetrasperma FGSC 2508]EGO51952.1 hypothetical protein NEUTE1DRAFT_113976 [Neurospora tetrasperma FGSC 2508]